MTSAVARFILACSVIGTSIGCIRPPRPELQPQPTPPPALPPSRIDVPVTLDLRPVFEEIERTVPRSWPAEGAWTYPPGRNDVRYRYHAERTPFTLSMNGAVLNLGTILHYRAEGQKRVLGVWLGGSCGHGGEWPRRVRVAFASDASVTPAYALATSTTLTDLSPLNPCKVTFLGIDVTASILSGVRGPLGNAGSVLDREAGSLSAQSVIQRGWTLLQEPLSVESSAWLMINPSEVRFGGFNGDGSSLSTSFGLTARPVIVTGARRKGPVVALPPLSLGKPGSGFHVLADAVIDHTTASRLLTAAVRGQRLTYGKRHITLREASVYGAGSDTLVVRIKFDGSKRGHLYLFGRLQYDPLSGVLSVPDLDYTIETRNIRARVAAWLLDDRIRDVLRANARWDLAPAIASVKSQLDAAINRDVGDGVRLHGSVDSIDVVGIRADGAATRVRVRADGSVSAHVSPQTLVSDKP